MDERRQSLAEHVAALEAKIAAFEAAHSQMAAELAVVRATQRRGLSELERVRAEVELMDKAAAIIGAAQRGRPRRPRPPWLDVVQVFPLAAGGALVACVRWMARGPRPAATAMAASALLTGGAVSVPVIAYRTVPQVVKVSVRRSSPSAYVTAIPADVDRPRPPRTGRAASPDANDTPTPDPSPSPPPSPSPSAVVTLPPVPSPAQSTPLPTPPLPPVDIPSGVQRILSGSKPGPRRPVGRTSMW